MRIEWLHKKESDRLIIFCNGWGMDGKVVAHMTSDCDVVMVYDYRELKGEITDLMLPYRKVHVVAWSMGVWAATSLFKGGDLQSVQFVGLNGTGCPVNDRYGIPEKIYLLTEKGMSEQGREKFLRRMVDNADEWEWLKANKPQRERDEVCEELTAIRRQSCSTNRPDWKWDKVYISEKDVIFPVANQLEWWQSRAKDIKSLSGGHCPFAGFRSWDDVLMG